MGSLMSRHETLRQIARLAPVRLLKMAITTCNRLNKYVGICGQGPSDHFDFAEWLVKTGIQTMSLNPDTVVETWRKLAEKGTAGK